MNTKKSPQAQEFLGAIYVFSDIDGCLIFSRDGTPQPYVLATDFAGNAIAFASEKQMHFLQLLMQVGELVPTTARSSRSYRQVRLDHNGWAIVSHGAVILQPDGQPQSSWLERTRKLAADQRGNFAMLLDSLSKNSGLLELSAGERVVEDFDLPIFLKASVSKDSGQSLSKLLSVVEAELGDQLAGWRFADHDYYIEMVPPYARKEAAVQYFLDEVAEQNRSFVVGMGDMHTDLGFVALCDYFFTPTQSQVFKSMNIQQ